MNERQNHAPPEQAVALLYDESSPVNAPVLIAKGKGATAQAIASVASRNDVPLYQDPALVSVLGQLPLGEEIPEGLYVAVAEVLAFAYHLSGREPEVVRRRRTAEQQRVWPDDTDNDDLQDA